MNKFSKYFAEVLRYGKENSVTNEILKEFQNKVGLVFDIKKYNETSDEGKAYYVEKIITEKILIPNPKYQRALLGVEFTNQTLVKTNCNPFDIMGRAKYVNSELRKKFNIKLIDEINVECKPAYSPHSMTKIQLEACKNGLMGAVLSFCGSYTSFVENTKCPVIFVDRISEEIVKNFKIYPTNIEDAIMSIVEEQVSQHPSILHNHASISNFTEVLLWASNPLRYRNKKYPYAAIFYLSQSRGYRNSYQNESEESYHERVFEAIDSIMNNSNNSFSSITKIDNAFPHNMERFRFRYAPKSNKKGIKVPGYHGSIFEEMSINKLFDTKIIKDYNENQGYSGSVKEVIVTMSKWLVKKYGINRIVNFIKDESCYSHIYQNFIPKISDAYTLSPSLRSVVKSLLKNND